MLQELHWLPVAERIDLKILLLAFKSINGIAPSYYNHNFLLNHYAQPINPYFLLLNVILGGTDTAVSFIAQVFRNSQTDNTKNIVDSWRHISF